MGARRTLVDGLRTAGIDWAATCVARSDVDPRRLTIALLTASVLDADAGAPPPAVAAALTAQVPGRVADVVSLPPGNAVVVVEDRSIGSPESTAGHHHVRQMQVLIPVGPGRLLALGLATSGIADWDTWVDPLAGVARSVRPS